jgi:hypothetical protein
MPLRICRESFELAVGSLIRLKVAGAICHGQPSAIIYTVIESCRRRGLAPLAYLRDVLTRLPNITNHQIPELRSANGR